MLTPADVADEANVHVQTVLAEIHRGHLRAARVGRHWRIRREWLDEYLNSGGAVAA